MLNAIVYSFTQQIVFLSLLFNQDGVCLLNIKFMAPQTIYPKMFACIACYDQLALSNLSIKREYEEHLTKIASDSGQSE